MLSRSPIPHTNQPEQSSPVQHRLGQCKSQSNCKMPRYQRLRQVDIPEQVHNEYTPWVRFTLLRLQEKLNGTIRLCLHHSRGLNKGIQRNPKYVRAIDDVIPKVSGASHLTIVDGRSGFWQVKLDDESNKLCTSGPHGQSTDGEGYHLDLPATEMCSKSEWILYSENLMV